MPVIALMMAMTSVLFGGFGAAGYAAGFGDCPLILNCLPATALTRAVQWCLVLSLLVSSPIQLYIISESLEPMLVQSAANTPPHQPPPAGHTKKVTGMQQGQQQRTGMPSAAVLSTWQQLSPSSLSAEREGSDFGPSSLSLVVPGQVPYWKTVAVRVVLVALTSTVAVTVNNFAIFTNLIGSIFVPVAGFILPSTLYLVLARRGASPVESQARGSPFIRASLCYQLANVLIIILGILTMVIGISSALKDL